MIPVENSIRNKVVVETWSQAQLVHPQIFQFSATDFDHVAGISKRELYAAMAMQGMLAGTSEGNSKTLANRAVDYADALIAELNMSNKE